MAGNKRAAWIFCLAGEKPGGLGKEGRYSIWAERLVPVDGARLVRHERLLGPQNEPIGRYVGPRSASSYEALLSP